MRIESQTFFFFFFTFITFSLQSCKVAHPRPLKLESLQVQLEHFRVSVRHMVGEAAPIRQRREDKYQRRGIVLQLFRAKINHHAV